MILRTLPEKDFAAGKRELLLDFTCYSSGAANASLRIPRVTAHLADAHLMADKSTAAAMRMTNNRAINAVKFLALSYSGGIRIAEMRDWYPSVLEYWEQFAARAEAFDEGPESEDAWVAHLALQGPEFAIANQLVSLGILLGWGDDLMPRLAKIIDYRNPKMDGMLERMLEPFVPGRPAAPDECTKHLPYFKSLKIFNADQEDRPALMAKYLAEWYVASRREPYYESHTREGQFVGYWSWEAAAITFLLGIDDSTYADAMFYPKDLVDFARAMSVLPPPGAVRDSSTMRVQGGQACPQAGYWTTPAQQDSRRLFKSGEVMPTFEHSAYGATIWQWDEDQVS